MEIQENDILKIKDALKSIQTTADLSDLLNIALRAIYPDGKIKIRTNQLHYYADRNNSKRYTTFSIPKKNGDPREIKAPVASLKRIQKALNLILSIVFEPHPNSTGFLRNKNLLDNASPHIGKYYIYNIDLKDFFPSITYGRVKACLEIPPFNLPSELSCLIANICCDEARLPQGAPTSPLLSNIICQRLDRKLSGLSKTNKVSYTRYADDLTFSSYYNVFNGRRKFRREVFEIIENQGFLINEDKIRLQGDGYRKIVTGLVVNEKVNLERNSIRNLRALLNSWKKSGYAVAEQNFMSKKGTSTSLALHVAGKLSYMKMIRGKDDLLCKKYEDQFRSLLLLNFNKEEHIKNTLEIWKILGLEKSISYYNRVHTLNMKTPSRLLVKYIGEVRKNRLDMNQRWILFEDVRNHKKSGFVLFENQFPDFWRFISDGKDIEKTIFHGEIMTVQISNYLLKELGIIPETEADKKIIDSFLDVPVIYAEHTSILFCLKTAIIKKIRGMNFN